MTNRLKDVNNLVKYGVLVLVVGGVLLVSDDRLFHAPGSVCLHQALFNKPCPLCGMTRSLHELLGLRLSSALQYNPLVLFLPVFLILEVGTDLGGGIIWRRFRTGTVVLALLGAAVLYGFRLMA